MVLATAGPPHAPLGWRQVATTSCRSADPAEVAARDEAWRRLGFKSRAAMLRKAIANLLEAGCAT